ncbi:MAG: hypothetical protein K8L99_24055 [Anaerolineae bacterium]|nr:hypothetical protein [Anaerolineae bacterium]
MEPMVTPNQPQPNSPPNRIAYCPSCGKRSAFSYSGTQRWPERVARAAGLKAVITLWNCENCHSTISEQNLIQ